MRFSLALLGLAPLAALAAPLNFNPPVAALQRSSDNVKREPYRIAERSQNLRQITGKTTRSRQAGKREDHSGDFKSPGWKRGDADTDSHGDFASPGWKRDDADTDSHGDFASPGWKRGDADNDSNGDFASPGWKRDDADDNNGDFASPGWKRED